MFKVFVPKKMSDRDEGCSNDKLIEELLSVMVEYVSRHIQFSSVPPLNKEST